MADPFLDDLIYPYHHSFYVDAPLYRPNYPVPAPRPESPFDLLHDFRPTFPVIRDLPDHELLSLTDLHLFERQRRHVEILHDKTRYVEKLMRFLDNEGKFSISNLCSNREDAPRVSQSGASSLRDVPLCHLNPRHYIPGYAAPLQLSPGAFPHGPPNVMSYYQPIHTPHAAGGVRFSSITSATKDQLLRKEAEGDQGQGAGAGEGKCKGKDKDMCGEEREGRWEPKGNEKGKSKASSRSKGDKKGLKPPDPNLEKRWALYFQSRFRYHWETRCIDAEIRTLEAAVESVVTRTGEHAVSGGGLKRSTLNDIARLRELRVNGGWRQGAGGPACRTLDREVEKQGLITQLPTELLHQIFSYFRPVQLAAAHSLVCRRWNAIATPIIYRKIPFGDYTEDYWVEVSRRKRVWKKEQATKGKMERANATRPGEPLKNSLRVIFHDDYLDLSGPPARNPGPQPPSLLQNAFCDGDYKDDYERDFNEDSEGAFFPDGKQATKFPLGGPALVVMPWSISIIKAIGNPHLAKHVRHVDYQGSSYNSFPNHNEARKVFTDLANPRPMLDQRFRTLSKLLQLVKKAVRVLTRVEILELNSGDERISNALLGILKWSPRLERLAIGNTNLAILHFSRGTGKGDEALIDRNMKGKARAQGREEIEDLLDPGFASFGSSYVTHPKRDGLKIRIKSALPGENFYYPSLKSVLLYRCGYTYSEPRETTLEVPPGSSSVRRGRNLGIGSVRDRQRRRRRRMRVRIRIGNGEKHALEKVVLFLQRCKNLEELHVKGCQFLPEALVDSKLYFNDSTEWSLTLPKLTDITIRSCGLHTHQRMPEVWLASPSFEAFFFRHKQIKHLGWNGWMLNRHSLIENPAFSRVARHLGRTLTSLSIDHGFDDEVAHTAPENLHRIRLNIKRFNLLLRNLPLLESIDWRMHFLPVSKFMMAIRNMRHCPLLKTVRVDGVMGIISQAEAREIASALPAVRKLRVSWRPRPCGYRRGRGTDPHLLQPHQLPIWYENESPMDWDSPPPSPLLEPPPPPGPPFLPLPTEPTDSDADDPDWSAEADVEPVWTSADELADIFSDSPFLDDLVINVTIRVAGELKRVTRRSLVEKVRQTAIAFAHRCKVRRVGIGYFSDVQGLRVFAHLDRQADGKPIGWWADIGDMKVWEDWRTVGGEFPPTEEWISGALGDAQDFSVQGGWLPVDRDSDTT